MSKLKISEGLFLEKQELDRFQKFIFEDGFKKHLLHNSVNFGLIRNQTLDPIFSWGRIETGTNAKTIKVNFTEALTKNGDVTIKLFEDNISVPDDGNWYWVKLSHLVSDMEEGLVSIDALGNMTGVGTKFKEILRGQPNFPSAISFLNSIYNTLDYEVVEVIDDANTVLSGFFSAESNLKYRTVGTFTPGKVPSTSEKGCFQYDSATVSLILETVLDTKPTSFIDGEDFALARVRISGSQTLIQDKRTELWQTLAFVESTYVTPQVNPLVGVEAIKFDALTSTKAENILYLAWGMRSVNWLINTNLNLITLSSSNGGKYKTAADFSDGDLDGWRVYLPASGKYMNILSSIKTGGQINLTLDTLNPTDFADTTQEVVVVPNAESIEFLLVPDQAIVTPEQLTQVYLFPIYERFGRIRANAFATESSYNVKYRYKTGNRYSQYRTLPADSVGYYNEQAFDDDGILTTSASVTPYTPDDVDGYIVLNQHPNAYSIFAKQVVTGDLFGINLTVLDNANPVKFLTVGTDKAHQVYNSNITFTTDHFIDLKTADLKDGNRFVLQFKKIISPSTFKLRITQGFINTGSIGTVLWDFSVEDFNSINKYLTKGLQIECVFDEETATWQLTELTDVEGTISRPLVGYRSAAVEWFKVGEVKLPLSTLQYEGALFSLEYAMTGGNNIEHGANVASFSITRTGASFPPSNSTAGISYAFAITSGYRKWGTVNAEDVIRALVTKNNSTDGIVVEIWMKYNLLLQNIILTPIVLAHTVSALTGGDKAAVTFLKPTSGVAALPSAIVTIAPSHYLATLQAQVDNIQNVLTPRSKTYIQDVTFNTGGGNTGAGWLDVFATGVAAILGANPSGPYQLAINLAVKFQRNRFPESTFIHTTRVLKNGVPFTQSNIYRQGQKGWHGGSYAVAGAISVVPGDVILIQTNLYIADDPFQFENDGAHGTIIVTANNG